MNNIQNMMQAAQDNRPADFNKHFQTEVSNRIVDRINDLRPEVISQVFSLPVKGDSIE